MSTDVALLVRVAASLVAVLLLALVAARLARRGSGRRGHGDLCVRERVGLTRDTAAVVLETGGRRLLVGVSPAQVSLLADLGAAEPVIQAGEVVATGPEAPRTVPIELGTPVRDVLASLPRQARPGTPSAAPFTVAPSAVAPFAAPAPSSAPSSAQLSRRAIRELDRKRRVVAPPTQRGTGSVLDPRTWQQGLEALRDLTARRG